MFRFCTCSGVFGFARWLFEALGVVEVPGKQLSLSCVWTEIIKKVSNRAPVSSVGTWDYYNIINKKFFPRFCLFNAESCFFHRRGAENRRILSYDHFNTRGQTWWSKRLFCSFYALSPLEISIKFDMKTSTNISLCSSFIYMYILHFPVCQSCFFCNTFFPN